MKQPQTFFFYDLETSGFSAAHDRIMQFAGQRTDMDLQPIGEPVNLLIKLAEDVLPSPEAILVTKITPQQTHSDGLTEAEFAQIFMDGIATPGTIFVGFNSVRFDDEFMRHTLWRNFRDPYEWQWSDGRSRWDLLDVVRLTRALRPDGINWPFTEKKVTSSCAKSQDPARRKMDSATNKLAQNDKIIKIPTNNLVDLARENGFENVNAHDALADVQALINVAKLLKDKQPQIFDYLLKMREKKEVAKLVNLENPVAFVYASGRYSSEFDKTTVAFPLAPGKNPGSVLVWDLRVDPNGFAQLSDKEINAKIYAKWEERTKPDFIPLPVKEMAYNRCPAVAPLGTLDQDAQKRLKIDLQQIEKNLGALKKNRDVIDRIVDALNSRPGFAKSSDVEGQLYDSFLPDADKARVSVIRNASADDLADFHPTFTDERLPELLLRFKARNFAKSLSADEKQLYETWRAEKLQREIPSYMQTLFWMNQIAADQIPTNFANDSEKSQFFALKYRTTVRGEIDPFLLEELQLWAESIMPIEE